MDGNISASLLEEIFSEVDSAERPTPSVTGFLEDVAAAEAELVLGDGQLDKKKTKKREEPEVRKNDDEEKTSSLIHEGLTDSSDDEDNKYFEESKYNDCGRKLKNLLKEKTQEKNNCQSERLGLRESTFKNDENRSPLDGGAREKLKRILESMKKNPQSEGESNASARMDVDPILKMRIVNPLVSSETLRNKMIGRLAVGTTKIKTFLQTPQSKTIDWVTGGVITNKFTKTSQKGNVYIIWDLSDLWGDIQTISVFLFGSAYKEFWTTEVGTVVGILNPDVLNNSSKGRNEATLRVDNPHKILVMGMSKDFGTCKGRTKTGDSCKAIVNMAKCEFCTRHLQREYKQACRRTDLQPPKIGRLAEFKNKLMGNRPSSGGRTTVSTRITGQKSSKLLEKDRQRLNALCSDTPKLPSVTLPNPLNNNQQPNKSPLLKPTVSPKTPQTKPVSPAPQQRIVDLNAKITAADRAKAKAYALNYVRQHGPLKAPIGDGKAKRTPEQIASVKRKLEAEEDEKRAKKKAKESESESNSPKPDPKKEKLEKLGMTDKFFELMNAPVKDETLLNVAEKDRQDKYFDKLETREKMEEKMASTFKVECNAVRCLKCHYKAFSASDLCKREKHPLKVFKAFKRFWKCSNCPARTVSLELFPLHPCKNCGNHKWERSSMMPEKGPNLIVEPLSLRGMEEKFIGSVIKNASLNLLVPEEGPDKVT